MPDSITPVRGLVRDQRNSSDTSAEAARYFRDRLKAYGITAAGYYGRTNAASGAATLIASSQGSTLSTIGQPDAAQQRQRDRRGPAQAGRHARSATARRGAAPARPRPRRSRRRGSRPAPSTTGPASRAPTGSAPCSSPGSSTAASTPATQTKLWPLKSGLPTAGRTGTLASTVHHHGIEVRRRARCGPRPARLGDVVALAGLHHGHRRPGQGLRVPRQRQESSTTTCKQNVDMLAATVHGCY